VVDVPTLGLGVALALVMAGSRRSSRGERFSIHCAIRRGMKMAPGVEVLFDRDWKSYSPLAGAEPSDSGKGSVASVDVIVGPHDPETSEVDGMVFYHVDRRSAQGVEVPKEALFLQIFFREIWLSFDLSCQTHCEVGTESHGSLVDRQVASLSCRKSKNSAQLRCNHHGFSPPSQLGNDRCLQGRTHGGPWIRKNHQQLRECSS